MLMASSRAATDSPALRCGPPSATICSHSCCAPVASPSSKRPPLMMSRVAAARASMSGSRRGRLARFGNSVTREVRTATAVSKVIASSRPVQYG